MATSSELEAAFAKNRSLIDQIRRLAAIHESIQTSLKVTDTVLLTRSRAYIAESKRLLAGLATPTAAIRPNPAEVRTQPDHNSAMLSTRVVENGTHFGWTIQNRTNAVIGSGTAGTEFEARVEAFRAAMDYLGRLKGRSEPKISTLH